MSSSSRIQRSLLATLVILVSMAHAVINTAFAVDPYGPKDAKITVVVMDPMALPLACDCVKGYAQRRYEKLADYLQASLGESVRVVWSESLENALRDHTEGKVTIVIGKDSVVRSGAIKSKLNLKPVAHLTDMNGSTMQHGLFVVRTEDSAASLLDIEGYQVLWGPSDCDEKAAAPKAKLKDLEIATTDGGDCASCSVAAKQLMALPQGSKTVAVISSYAEPLLAGCGSVKKGDLRILGKSEEVPFVSAFVNGEVPQDKLRKIQSALMDMKSPEMLSFLETKNGFVEYK